MLAVARYMAGTGDTAFLDEAMWKPACWRRGKWVRFWSGCGPTGRRSGPARSA